MVKLRELRTNWSQVIVTSLYPPIAIMSRVNHQLIKARICTLIIAYEVGSHFTIKTVHQRDLCWVGAVRNVISNFRWQLNWLDRRRRLRECESRRHVQASGRTRQLVWIPTSSNYQMLSAIGRRFD